MSFSLTGIARMLTSDGRTEGRTCSHVRRHRPDARPERASSGAGSRCGDDPVPELDGVVPKV
ncbi:hypothetical protein, partial [Streptomyces sp. NPDC094144]|uniref:hypothetical protein n=1 Tax=Streptomyces sp. NPDC094144 TaxID=3366056 RepID=UPI003811AD23